MSRRADHRRKSRRAREATSDADPTGWIPRMRALGVRVEQREDRIELRANPGHALDISGGAERRAAGRWMWSLAVRHPGVDRTWVIEPEDAFTRMRKLVAGQDVLTGDAPFDDAVHVVGDELALLGLLSHAVRGWLTELLPQGRLADGCLRWSAPATGPRPPGVVEVLRSMIAVMRTFGARAEPLTRLRRQMVADPVAGYRRRAFERVVLAGHAPTVSERRQLLRDPDLELRFAAARALTDVETLGRLAANPEVPEAMRLQAIDRLGECPGAAAVAALDRAADGCPAPPRLARALGRALVGERGAVETLCEAALAALVEHGPGEAAGEAIDRLGEVGTERAVPALAAVAGAFFGRRALKERARAAIGRITTRQGGLRRGGLSVTGGEEGGLSPADR